jgi:hypothetical protein
VDTRSKIVKLSAWVVPTLKPLVSGYFDPLLAVHVERLEALYRELGPLTVILNQPPDAIVPLDARASVVAALQCVETVVLPDGCRMPEARLRFEEEELALRASYFQLVLDRES